jgi:hypothetical protein
MAGAFPTIRVDSEPLAGGSATRPVSSYRRIGLAGALIAVAAILYTVLQTAISRHGLGEPLGSREDTAERIVLLVLWAAAAPAIIWSAGRFPLHRGHWLPNAIVHLLLGAAFVVAINFLAPPLALLAVDHRVDWGLVWRVGTTGIVQVGHLALVVYAFIVGVGHYLQALEARRMEALRAEQLRADWAEAELRALQLQLQPHFLFNTLNAVNALILTRRNEEAVDVVGKLGDLLRAVLATERQSEISLREELEFARAYLDIESVRFGERLRVSWEVAPELLSAPVPAMLLQPLLENAIRHGIGRKLEGGAIAIRAALTPGRLRLEVVDDGPRGSEPSREVAAAGGVGLENLRKRLAHLYGNDQLLELERSATHTRAVVELPWRAGAFSERR